MKRAIFLLAGLGFALPVAASPSVPLRCGANLDRIWVYDNLTTLDVSAHLKCGTPVDVLGMEKGYVKVRTADGNEGYVPPDAIPSSEMAALTAAAPPAAPPPTVAAAARTVISPAAQIVAATQPAPAIVMRTVPAPVPAQAPAQVPAQPVVAQASASPAPQVEPKILAMATPPAPSAAPVASTPIQSKPVPANNPAPLQAPAPVAPATTHANVAQAAPHVAPAPRVAPAVQADLAQSTAQPSAPPSAATVAVRASEPPASHTATHENAMFSIEQPKIVDKPKSPSPAPSTEPVQLAMVVRAADITPVAKAATVHDAEYSEEDDTPDTVATPADDFASCNVYFSAYGVTPMQYKWMADARGKQFPAVCPAPEPSMVDYVVIFTHDEDSFSSALPDPVHTDRNGFSDWSPVTAADDTHIPLSVMDKAHHEYAWVFHVRRGTFDPSNFTSRRHPQFTKTETSGHASSKSIEDAMQYIADNNSHQ